MFCNTEGHRFVVTASWIVYTDEDNVILMVCSGCAQVAMKMGAHVRRIDNHVKQTLTPSPD